MERGHIRLWAARYWGALRRSAVSYTKHLDKFIGLKKGLGPGDIRWILRELGAFYRQELFGDRAANFLTESAVGVAEIQAPKEADSYFQRTLTSYAKSPSVMQPVEEADSNFQKVLVSYQESPSLMRPVREELLEAQELYGRTKKSDSKSGSLKPTAAEMLANPDAFPVMNAKQVMEVIPVVRSTVDAWANDGTLTRVGKKTGERARLLVSTKSVKKLTEA